MHVHTRNIDVKIYNKKYLNKITIYDVYIDDDINLFYANYILKDYLPNNIKDISYIDYEKIFYLSKKLHENKVFFNNGVIYEWITSEVISEKNNFIPLMKIESSDLERAEYGPDIIFLNPADISLHFFEVKSSESSNTINSHIKLLYNSLKSIYLSKQGNKSLKIIDAKNHENLISLQEEEKTQTIEMLNNILECDDKMFDIRKKKSLYINSATFIKKANYFDETNFEDDFNKEIKFSMEQFINEYKKLNKLAILNLDNITIIHRFINIVVDTKVSVKEIYLNMMNIIEKEELHVG